MPTVVRTCVPVSWYPGPETRGDDGDREARFLSTIRRVSWRILGSINGLLLRNNLAVGEVGSNQAVQNVDNSSAGFVEFLEFVARFERLPASLIAWGADPRPTSSVLYRPGRLRCRS